MGHPEAIQRSKQLLVEGNDPKNFFGALLSHLAITDVQIQNYGGVTELRGFLKAFKKMPDFDEVVTSVGIVRDAEGDASAAFQSVHSSLGAAQLPLPATAEQPTLTQPALCVLILPGQGKRGMLESLLCQTLRHLPVDGCIDEFFSCAARVASIRIKNKDKARTFAYLATQRNPRHSVGVATKKGVWDLDHDALTHVRAFLTNL